MDYFLSLHKKFAKMGMARNKLMNEMLYILPEIYESGIYKKFASTIIEYAGKYGGISKSAVEKRLGMEKHLQDKPKLKEAIKKVGLNKVAMVVTLATPENEEAFVDKLENMSKPAVQTLSKELRQKNVRVDGNGVSGDGLSSEMICEAKPEKIKMELDEEMTFLFLKLKKKWGNNMSNKQIMRMILAKISESEFPIKKIKIVPGENSTKPKKDSETHCIPAHKKQKSETRYISVHKKRKTSGDGKCSYPNCNKPAEVFHHTDRFSESKSHESIVALCKDHHEFMHNGLVRGEKADARGWKLDVRGHVAGQAKNRADILYRKFRQEAML